jgi:hypothetical protein
MSLSVIRLLRRWTPFVSRLAKVISRTASCCSARFPQRPRSRIWLPGSGGGVASLDPYARPGRSSLFRVGFRLAGPHQHIPEVGYSRRHEVKESIEISFTQAQDSTIDITSLHIVIPADDLQGIWDLLRPEHFPRKGGRLGLLVSGDQRNGFVLT